MKNLTLLFIFGFFLLSSCEKRKWKLPADVDFRFDINHTESSDSTLSFSGGYIVLGSFEFEGEREQGDDVFFTKEFAGGLKIPFDASVPVTELDFTIPQGSYTRIAIEFDTHSSTGASIMVEGIFSYDNTDYPVRFEFESSETFEITAEDEDGSNLIILNKDIPAVSTIVLDPIYWFATISANQLISADRIEEGGKQIILINEEVNEHLYDIIDDRIDKAAESVFKNQ